MPSIYLPPLTNDVSFRRDLCADPRLPISPAWSSFHQVFCTDTVLIKVLIISVAMWLSDAHVN